ncbi:MAG: hypothetical protein ACJAVY_000338 [Marinoscillum sp.]|jgi:hypothetical protein
MITIYKITFSILGVFATTALMAQSAPPATPIDGGLSLLLAAGGVYGLKKLRDHRKSH